MNEKGQQEADGKREQTSWSGYDDSNSIRWRDISETACGISGDSAITDEFREMGETDANAALQAPRRALDALQRATELFVGLSEPIDEQARTFVAELPQWFQHPAVTEARIQVGDTSITTDGFRQTADGLTADTHTRTGRRISVTVVRTDQRPDPGGRAWLATEQELLETLVSLIGNEADRWEIDSLKRVSDGVVALDADLQYTYVNQQAERLLGRDRDELTGTCVWDIFPEAAGTVAQERIETALETGRPASFERYNAQEEQWVEARVYPGDDGVILIFTDITELKASERQVEQMLETTPAGIVVLTEAGEITRANARAEELLGLSRSDIEGRRYDSPDWDIWDTEGVAVPPEDHPVTHAIRTGETVQGFTHGITLPDGSDRWLSSNVTPVFDDSGSIERVVVALEDITVLKRLEQLIETFQPVNEVLNNAATRRETETTICDLLTDTRQYQYARIAEHTPGTALTDSSLRNRSEVVSSDESVDSPVHPQRELGPTREAVETGNIQVVTTAGDDARFEEWREHLRDHGFQGGALVPLGHRDRIYGLLALYTARGDSLGEREQTLLSTLGDRIGQVLYTLETERVVHADTVTELTFRSTDPGSFFVSVSETLGCTLDIRDTIPVSDETLVYYVSVQGASLDDLSEVAADADCPVQMRGIRQTENPPGGDVELELQQQSLAHTLISMGAVVMTDTVTDGRAEVVCEVPLGHDIDSLVTSLTASFPETDLVAKREYNRSARTVDQTSSETLADVFREDLTDRQRQVIRAGIHTGYFESPRQSTATEVADALSLTQSTFSYHLRNAQQTLFEAMLDRL